MNQYRGRGNFHPSLQNCLWYAIVVLCLRHTFTGQWYSLWLKLLSLVDYLGRTLQTSIRKYFRCWSRPLVCSNHQWLSHLWGWKFGRRETLCHKSWCTRLRWGWKATVMFLSSNQWVGREWCRLKSGRRSTLQPGQWMKGSRQAQFQCHCSWSAHSFQMRLWKCRSFSTFLTSSNKY